MGERLYGLDWLRIGAFGLLIFYHIGMVFVTWDWHIKSPEPVAWAELPMLALSPWRLSLLFLVSGVASAYLLAKSRVGAFARSRTARLLIPLLAGIILFVPPQPWVELTVQHGHANSFGAFWAEDYFRFSTLEGIILPTWNHLWFVAYLWVYSLVLALLAALLSTPAKEALIRRASLLLSGWRILALPLLVLWALRMTLFPIFEETHALVDDWYNHAAYGLVFAIGLLLAHSQQLRASFVAWRRPALLLAAIGYAGYATAHLAYPDSAPEPGAAMLALIRLLRTCEGWGAIVALVGTALRWSPRDSAQRRYLTEAIFPYYIVHQMTIVLVAFWLRPFGLGNGATVAVLVAATVLGCALFYEVARRSGPLRPLFGLKAPERRSKSQPAVAH